MNEQTFTIVTMTISIIIGGVVGYVLKKRRAKKYQSKQNERQN